MKAKIKQSEKKKVEENEPWNIVGLVFPLLKFLVLKFGLDDHVQRFQWALLLPFDIVMKNEMWWTCMQCGDCISTMDEKWIVMDDIKTKYLKDEQKRPLNLSYWKLSIGQNWLWLKAW